MHHNSTSYHEYLTRGLIYMPIISKLEEWLVSSMPYFLDAQFLCFWFGLVWFGFYSQFPPRCGCPILTSCLTLCNPMDYGMPGSSASTISPNLFRIMSFVWVMLSNHLILSCPVILCLPSFPASGSLPVSQLFTSGGQNIGSLPAVFPVNIHIFPQLSSFSRV